MTEYAAVSVRVHSVDATVVSVYVRLGVVRDPSELVRVRWYRTDIVLTCGDYNARYESCGDSRTDARGEALFDVVVAMRLIALNDGRETFVRHGENGSVLDLSLASLEFRSCVLWCFEPDLWGSDHLPIRLVFNQSRPSKVRTHRVTNWDVYRQGLQDLYGYGELEDISHDICVAMFLAT